MGQSQSLSAVPSKGDQPQRYLPNPLPTDRETSYGQVYNKPAVIDQLLDYDQQPRHESPSVMALKSKIMQQPHSVRGVDFDGPSNGGF